jgi:hypothetical protein
MIRFNFTKSGFSNPSVYRHKKEREIQDLRSLYVSISFTCDLFNDADISSYSIVSIYVVLHILQIITSTTVAHIPNIYYHTKFKALVGHSV